METYCLANGVNSIASSDLDTPFVADYFFGTTTEGEVIMRIAWTTRRMATIGPNEGGMFHFDFTYKTNTHGYPVGFGGQTDADRVIHLQVVGISTGETEVDVQFYTNAESVWLVACSSN